MRIISGIYKGKRLQAPKSLPVRPTTDFAKEALFNILNHEIDFSEVSMLDLFSGTGNIAYEFASRG
ncbi:MAG: 16S rRNA (guanine966-N2)-methyltransferase, partial [Candidatus Latescibacterota bacterium]